MNPSRSVAFNAMLEPKKSSITVAFFLSSLLMCNVKCRAAVHPVLSNYVLIIHGKSGGNYPGGDQTLLGAENT